MTGSVKTMIVAGLILKHKKVVMFRSVAYNDSFFFFFSLTVKKSGLNPTCLGLLQDFSLKLILPILLRVDCKE